MANTIMRNRVTTEYRTVEKDSQEFYSLRAELHADGRPRWEQTGEHDLRAFEERRAADALAPTDRGDGEPVPVLGMPAPDVFTAPQRGLPTDAEIEQSAGRAAGEPESLAQTETLSHRVVGTGVIEGTAEVGNPGQEAEAVPLEGAPNVAQTGGEMGTSSGGGNGGNGGSNRSGKNGDMESSSQYSSKGYDDLKAECEARDLQVEGSGNGGRVLKSDFVKALEEDDASKGEQTTPA